MKRIYDVAFTNFTTTDMDSPCKVLNSSTKNYSSSGSKTSCKDICHTKSIKLITEAKYDIYHKLKRMLESDCSYSMICIIIENWTKDYTTNFITASKSFMRCVFTVLDYGRVDLLEFLIDNTRIKSIYLEIKPIIQKACSVGNVAVMKWFLENFGEEINDNSKTYYKVAACYGHINLLELMQENNISILPEQIESILYKYFCNKIPVIYEYLHELHEKLSNEVSSNTEKLLKYQEIIIKTRHYNDDLLRALYAHGNFEEIKSLILDNEDCDENFFSAAVKKQIDCGCLGKKLGCGCALYILTNFGQEQLYHHPCQDVELLGISKSAYYRELLTTGNQLFILSAVLDCGLEVGSICNSNKYHYFLTEGTIIIDDDITKYLDEIIFVDDIDMRILKRIISRCIKFEYFGVVNYLTQRFPCFKKDCDSLSLPLWLAEQIVEPLFWYTDAALKRFIHVIRMGKIDFAEKFLSVKYNPDISVGFEEAILSKTYPDFARLFAKYSNRRQLTNVVILKPFTLEVIFHANLVGPTIYKKDQAITTSECIIEKERLLCVNF